MARIPMVGDQVFDRKKMADDLRRNVLEQRRELPARIAEAEGRGEHEEVAGLRQAAKDLEKLIADYGLDR